MGIDNQKREAIVSQAIGIASQEKRAAYLDQVCGNDTELKHQVEQRIEEHFHNESRMGSARAPDNARPDSERSPRRNGANHEEDREGQITRLGSYKVSEQIGEGAS